jgi:hypothetical protein
LFNPLNFACEIPKKIIISDGFSTTIRLSVESPATDASPPVATEKRNFHQESSTSSSTSSSTMTSSSSSRWVSYKDFTYENMVCAGMLLYSGYLGIFWNLYRDLT